MIALLQVVDKVGESGNVRDVLFPRACFSEPLIRGQTRRAADSLYSRHGGARVLLLTGLLVLRLLLEVSQLQVVEL